jgi:tRNA threonylcarbamoyladenosine biosynthesis protein TsaE
MQSIVTTTEDIETQRLGRAIGETFTGGEILLLIGSLGAGKTKLTQGIAYGLDVKEYTKSPSFVLVNEYLGRVPLIHMDLYRIEHPKEVLLLGLDDYISDSSVVVVEWGDRGRPEFPSDHLTINIKVISEDVRQLVFDSWGVSSDLSLKRIMERWDSLDASGG